MILYNHSCKNLGVAGLIVPISSAYIIADRRLLTKNDDMNNISDGRYYYLNADAPANSTGYNATVFQFTTNTRSDIYQIVFDSNTTAVYLRAKFANGWTTWKTLLSFTG